jgi:hypothetical protein
MTTVLTVMSGMDPHTIKNVGLVWMGVGSQLVLCFRSNCRSGLYGRFDVTFRGEELLA